MPGAGGKRGTEVCSIVLRVTGKRFKPNLLTDEGFDSLNQTVWLTVADQRAGPFAFDIRWLSLA